MSDNKCLEDLIKEENKIIKSSDSSVKQKLEAYCNKNIRSLNSQINNLKSVNKKSPLLEFYRGKLQAYKNIKNMLEC